MWPHSMNFTTSSEQGHDCLPPYQFISEEVLEQAYGVVAPILASFGLKPPALPKFKASGTSE